MNESISKIVEWAKTHPWLAAGIVGLVILLAWWFSKQVGGSSDSAVALDTGEMTPGQPDASGLGGILGSGSAAPGPDLGTAIPTNPIESTPTPSLPSIPSIDSSVFDSGAGIFDTIPTPDASGPTTKGLIGGLSVPGVKAARVPETSSSRSSKPRPTQDSTPAMAYGKGRHFTGVIVVNGVPTTFINGYPVQNVTVLGSNPVTGSYAAGTDMSTNGRGDSSRPGRGGVRPSGMGTLGHQ